MVLGKFGMNKKKTIMKNHSMSKIREGLKKAGMRIRKKSMRSTCQRLNQMIEEAMDGTFSEEDYEETELSKLEAKWKRFLTSAKLSHQKVEEERKNIKELVSDISHQTKTPLANILLYGQLLEEQNLDETSRKLVSEIVRQSEKLDFLIQSLVKTSRLETGTFQFEKQKQKLYPILREIEEQAWKKAEQRKMRIILPKMEKGSKDNLAECAEVKTEAIYDRKEIEVAEAVCDRKEIEAVCDRKWTTEALYNILDNAVKYGNGESAIEISIEAYEMFVCITISNEGKGISEEEIPLVFQRFYRGKNTGETEGVGIGLYLARQIVEEQGGYIKVKSKAGGKTGFSVYLPKQ